MQDEKCTDYSNDVENFRYAKTLCVGVIVLRLLLFSWKPADNKTKNALCFPPCGANAPALCINTTEPNAANNFAYKGFTSQKAAAVL